MDEPFNIALCDNLLERSLRTDGNGVFLSCRDFSILIAAWKQLHYQQERRGRGAKTKEDAPGT